MLEQGMAASELHLLDQTKGYETEVDIPGWEKKKAIADKLYDPELAKEEIEGWAGLVDCFPLITCCPCPLRPGNNRFDCHD